MTVGRFAPSPSGLLHLGSLVTALASYLDARSRAGSWLVRIEDVDLTRCRIEYERSLLSELERHGLFWDGKVVRQSERTEIYAAVINELSLKGHVYSCGCSRRLLKIRGCKESPDGELIYPGFCRPGAKEGPSPVSNSVRFWIHDGAYEFRDTLAGVQSGSLTEEVGDFVLRRADGCFAYHLAVVVDDHVQGVTRVVRGRDILSSTGRHVVLQKTLGFATPVYAHIPLVMSQDGAKLSKSHSAKALAETSPERNLQQALGHLGIRLDLKDFSRVEDILEFALLNYRLT